MTKNYLQRFVDAQQQDYQTALTEIKSGRKRSHWMWYIFPQVTGLGHSETSKYYAIKNKAEASAYLQHPVLGPRLNSVCQVLLAQPGNDANKIFGSPDDMKLRSSLTLFSSITGANPIFAALLSKFFGGVPDHKTIDLLEHMEDGDNS